MDKPAPCETKKGTKCWLLRPAFGFYPNNPKANPHTHLEKESVLQSSPMFQLFVLLQARLQLPHTQRHVRHVLQHIAGRQGGTGQGHVRRTRFFGYHATIQIGHERNQATRFGIGRRCIGTEHVMSAHAGQGATQVGPKFGHQEGFDASVGNKGLTAVQIALTLRYQVENLGKGYGIKLGQGELGWIDHELHECVAVLLLFFFGNGLHSTIGTDGPSHGGRFHTFESVLKEERLVLQKPATEFLGLTVTKTQDKVRAFVHLIIVQALLTNDLSQLFAILLWTQSHHLKLFDLLQDLYFIEGRRNEGE